MYDGPPNKNTYVSRKYSGIYSVSHRFWPLDLGSFFWGASYHMLYMLYIINGM